MITPRNTHEGQQGLWESPAAAEAWRRNTATRMQALGPATERMLVLANIILDGKGFIPFYVYTLLQRSVVW